MAVFLRRASIQEMMCSTSEAADSRPGHLNCAGAPDSQGRMHMEHHSRKPRHTRGVMLGMLRHSCNGSWWPGVQESSARALSSNGGQGTTPSVPYPETWVLQQNLWQEEDNQGRKGLDTCKNFKELECRSVSEGKGVKTLVSKTGWGMSQMALLLNCRSGFCSGPRSGADEQKAEEEVMFPRRRRAEIRIHKQLVKDVRQKPDDEEDA